MACKLYFNKAVTYRTFYETLILTPRTPPECLKANELCGFWMSFRLWPSDILSSFLTLCAIAMGYMWTGIPSSTVSPAPTQHLAHRRCLSMCWTSEGMTEGWLVHFLQGISDFGLLGGRYCVFISEPPTPSTGLVQSRYLARVCWIDKWVNE